MWTIEQVADWMENDVGLPEYRSCILDNFINGRRLLMLEDPSHMPEINIHSLDHIKMITSKVRETFSTDFVLFCRSIGLPPRKPLTHCTWFKSRTGPTWGIRQNWARCDILRWMKIIMPEPIYLDHWDLVWYMKPDFPKVLFGKIPRRTTFEHIPHYVKPGREVCKEYTASRKFRLHKELSEETQQIWMEHREGSPVPKEDEQAKQRKKSKEKMRRKPTVPKKSRLDRPTVCLEGLVGIQLVLARRKMPKKKFLVFDH
ncbi:uncharacterized protein LOC126379588 [Pectinophora gossypiella]|uniref:uncharacterized protein LOC126379588 n=1 Tax=Pectinophora gossypiella TaxID=13191 RepID=UPI00214E3C08|nr:uncharacterized protein LOC126379588 [Pectinophora gossypiella]